jgi:hypothetical protein
MAEPKVDKIEKKLQEHNETTQHGELSDADVEKVAGGGASPGAIDTFKNK